MKREQRLRIHLAGVTRPRPSKLLAGRTNSRNVTPPVSRQSLRIAYLFTTFPKSTETFLQREVRSMLARGYDLRLYSLFGGGGTFAGVTVTRFSMWRLLELIWIIPWVAVSRWDVFGVLWHGLWTRRAPGWLNFWENMLGAGFAGVFAPAFRRDPPDLIHAAWGGAPATAAWILSRLGGYRYSAAAHAYDIYEHGGDWWLDEKLVDARFVHTSTRMGRNSLVERGHNPDRVHVVCRGIDVFRACRALRADRSTLHLICIARLVEKKGLFHQLEIYRQLVSRNVPFEARIIGDGPLRDALVNQIGQFDLQDRVYLLGHLAEEDVWEQLDWADALLHTGIVAASGDRDGLPNVIPEAMMAGVLVMTSPAAATTEAIDHDRTGWVLPVEESGQWCDRLAALREQNPRWDEVRIAARQWTEENYDGLRNADRLAELFESAVSS